MAPLRARATGATGLVTWPLPEATAPVPRLARSRLRSAIPGLPAAGGHVSRPRRAGHLLPGNIRDTSRNCQRDMSRNLVEGTGPPDFGLQAPGMARQAGSPVTVPGGGAWMPTASGLPVARRDTALVQARQLPAGAGPRRQGQRALC